MTTLAAPHRRSRRRYIPLLQRVAVINALLVVVAVVVTIAVLAPGKVSPLALNEELAAVLAAVALVVIANVLLLRRVVGPLQALTSFARQVDLTSLQQRMVDTEPTSEAGELALTFNEMLSRLDAERRESTGRVLRAQEDERMRIAQELHDQIGQDLTAVLLGLSRVVSETPASVRQDVIAINDAVRNSLENVRRIAIELRPEALDDLGLASALATLSDGFGQRAGVRVDRHIQSGLPQLSPEAELVVYRVAQEALTNIARHAATDRADLTVMGDAKSLTLVVRDHGRGVRHESAVDGTGLRGMRERASLVHANLQIGPAPVGAGTEVRLEVPLGGVP